MNFAKKWNWSGFVDENINKICCEWIERKGCFIMMRFDLTFNSSLSGWHICLPMFCDKIIPSKWNHIQRVKRNCVLIRTKESLEGYTKTLIVPRCKKKIPPSISCEPQNFSNKSTTTMTLTSVKWIPIWVQFLITHYVKKMKQCHVTPTAIRIVMCTNN